MKDNKFKILYITIFLMFVGFLFFAVNNAERGAHKERYNILKDALSRSVVQCYAIEGFYPPNIEYLENNYGLVVDHSKYIINYNIFASNIMPEFDVFSME